MAQTVYTLAFIVLLLLSNTVCRSLLLVIFRTCSIWIKLIHCQVDLLLQLVLQGHRCLATGTSSCLSDTNELFAKDAARATFLRMDYLTQVCSEIVVVHYFIVTCMNPLSIDGTLPHQLCNFPINHCELVLIRGGRCSRNQAKLIGVTFLRGFPG